MLVILRKISNKSSKKEEEAFIEGKKLKYFQIYIRKKKKCKDLPLIRDYLKKVSKENPEFIKIFDWIFERKGVREIRNLSIHHQNEKGKCEIYDGYLILYLNKKKPTKYTYKDIADIYRQLQFFNFLIIIPNYIVFLNLLFVLIKNEDDKDFKNN